MLAIIEKAKLFEARTKPKRLLFHREEEAGLFTLI